MSRTSRPSSRWIAASARNWSRGDVAEVRPTRTPTPCRLAVPRTTLASTQRLCGSRPVSVTGVPWPISGRADVRRREAGGLVTERRHLAGSHRATTTTRAAGCAVVSTRRSTSSNPSVSTSHFMRARSLLSRLPVCSNTRSSASIVGSRSSREVNSSSASAGCGLAPSPPAMNTRKPARRCRRRVRVDGDDADVVEHRLTAVGGAAGEVDLELARQALPERVAHEVAERRLGPLRDVEHLVRAGAGEVATLDVADGVAARLAGREPDRRRGGA